MNIMLLAGLSDQKLISKINPFTHLDFVNQIFLFRREPLVYQKVTCFSPPRFMRRTRIVSEIYRFFICVIACLRRNIDCVIGIHYFPHCLLAALMSLLFRKRFFVVITEEPRLYERNLLFWKILQIAEKIAVRGSYSRKYLLDKGISDSKIFILPNVFSFKDMPEHSETNCKYDVIFVGYFVRDKRPDILLQVLNFLKNQRKALKSLIVGDGPLRAKVQRLTDEFNLSENIEFTGFEENIYPYLQQSRIFLLTSETEGLPMVIIEALGCGLPCIVPDVGDIKDVIQDGLNGRVIEPLNVRQFAEACSQLLDDEVLYQQLSQNARNIRKDKMEEYSAANVAAVWKKAFSEIKRD